MLGAIFCTCPLTTAWGWPQIYISWILTNAQRLWNRRAHTRYGNNVALYHFSGAQRIGPTNSQTFKHRQTGVYKLCHILLSLTRRGRYYTQSSRRCQKSHYYRPRSWADNTFGSVRLSVRPFDCLRSPVWTVCTLFWCKPVIRARVGGCSKSTMIYGIRACLLHAAVDHV